MNYTIYNGELCHYGVKGMKWGQRRAQKKVTRKLRNAGVQAGRAKYERERGAEEYRKHDQNAKVFDKAAKKYESQGSYFRAEAARKSAAALRARGANLKALRDQEADRLDMSSKKYQEEASKFATKKRVNMGKKATDSILKEYSDKGYNRQRDSEEFEREQNMRARYGDENYERYERITGRSY